MASQLNTARIFHFNDFHRRLETFDDGSGGAAKLTTLLRQQKEEHPDSVVINVGDVAGDNTEPGPDAFDPMAPLFNRMGVDVMAPGDHEFEDPTNNYQSLRDGFITPFQGEVVCANVAQSHDGQPLEGTKPFTIRKLGGINIAFIGVVTRNMSSAVFPAMGAGLSKMPIEETLREQIEAATAQGADDFVVLAHTNTREMEEVAEQFPEIPLILMGHGHMPKKETPVVEHANGAVTYLPEAQAYGREVNEIRLTIDPEARKIAGVEITPLQVTADLEPDPVATEIVANRKPLQKKEIPSKKPPSQEFDSFEDLQQHLFPDYEPQVATIQA